MKKYLSLIVCLALCTGWALKSLAPDGAGRTLTSVASATQATMILHDGVVIPMEIEGEYKQAIALAGDTILAVGSDAEILALATPDTEVVDLEGRTVLPGILDPHTHLFNDAAGLGMTLDEVQRLALEHGITSVANLHTNESETEQFVAYAEAGNMRIRLSLYLIYNDSCGTVHGTWYEQYSPLGELAPRLRVGGVKILAERSVCGDEGAHPVISPELVSLVPRLHERGWDAWQLMLSPTELRDAIVRAQEKGYQVAIHAMGDLGIATSLDAIAAALDGSPNTYRHMVLRNWILTDELLGRYAELGIGALMEPSSKCERTYRYKNGPEFMRLLSRIRDLVATGAHVALDSDWPNWGPSTISPFVRLRCAVTDTYVPEMIAALEPPCPDIELPTDQTITAWQGLRMMTAEAAYAMHSDDRLGTLRPGKLADLIVVTADPLKTDPESLDQIGVMMTMVGGKIEFETPDYVALRSADSVQEATDVVAEEAPAATTIFYGGTVVSMTSPSDVHEAIALSANRILALGTDEEILALAGPETQRIDLQGRAVYPGFIDPHTHLMKDAGTLGFTWDSVQQFAFKNGVTAAAEMFCNPEMMSSLVSYASSGALRLRVFPFLIYNDSCDTVWGTWYEQYAPFAELAPRLRVGGVKMFAERSVCGDRGTEPVFTLAMQARFPQAPSTDYRGNQLILSHEQLAAAIRRAQEKGYQVAIHAIGDAGIEASLLGIADALAGKPNTLRHMILHDRFIRDDLLGLYAQYGILAVIEPTTPCWWAAWIPIVGAENGRYFGRWKDLVATGAHVACDSDAPFYGEQGFGPIQRLAALMGAGEVETFGTFESCGPYPSDQTLSAWQGLRMMTTEAAYALHLEEELGTLAPGKLADLVVLSADPLSVEPSALGDIRVLLTMVNGRIEWEDEVFSAEVTPQSSTRTVRIVTFNAEWLFDGVGDTAWRNAPQTVADADSHFADVAQWLAELDADYISLDEVENAVVLQRLADSLNGDYALVFIEGNHPTGQDTCALSRLTVEDCGRSWDSRAFPVDGSALACSAGTAVAPMHYWCDVSIEGIPVTIVGAHLCAYPLDCGRCNQREAEAAILRDVARAAMDRGREVILLGDLNDYDGDVLDRVGSMPISAVIASLKDIDPERPGPELVNVVERLPQEDRYSCYWDQNLSATYDEGEPFTQIDYILVSVGLARYVSSVRVDTSRGPGEVSDHWPIVVEFVLPRTAGASASTVSISADGGQDDDERARILFDESHNEINTLSTARAVSISPEHPEWYVFARLSAILAAEYQVESITQWPDESDLAACDVLIIASPQTDFSDSERATIGGFVERGGGLLLITDAGPAPALTNLASDFGIRFATPVVCSSTPDWDPESFWTNDVNGDHPITQEREPFHTNWGSAIAETLGTILIHSDRNTWLDGDGDGVKDAAEELGPFALAVALEWGSGRVVAIADNAFHDSMLSFLGNENLILNAIEWLSGTL